METWREVSGDICNIFIDKSEAESYGKIKIILQGDGVIAHAVYRWLPDVSGLGLAGQARRLTPRDPPKKEQAPAEHVEMWQDKLRRLETHGDEYELAPVYKINSVRMLLTGNASAFVFVGRQGSY